MSVVAQTPYTGVKRLFEDDSVDALDSCDRQQLISTKRARYRASPAGRCFHPCDKSYGSSLSTLAALRAIFPDMDDQVGLRVLRLLQDAGCSLTAFCRPSPVFFLSAGITLMRL
jgi:hypothetical protein